MAGSLSDGTTNLANVTIGTVNSNGASVGKLDLWTNSAKLSLSTGASASGMTVGELRLVFQASGLSIMYSSGATQYTVGSATSAVQS